MNSPNWSRSLIIEQVGEDEYLVQAGFQRLGVQPLSALPRLAQAQRTLDFGAKELLDPEWAALQRQRRDELNAMLPNKPYEPKAARPKVRLTLADLGLGRKA